MKRRMHKHMKALLTILAGKRCLNFASFTTKERLNFPVANNYTIDN